jgi:hypothetical protein
VPSPPNGDACPWVVRRSSLGYRGGRRSSLVPAAALDGLARRTPLDAFFALECRATCPCVGWWLDGGLEAARYTVTCRLHVTISVPPSHGNLPSRHHFKVTTTVTREARCLALQDGAAGSVCAWTLVEEYRQKAESGYILDAPLLHC